MVFPILFFLLFCVSDFWLVFCVWIVLAYNIISCHGDGGCDHNHNLFHRQLAILWNCGNKLSQSLASVILSLFHRNDFHI